MERLDLGVGLSWLPAWEEHLDRLGSVVEVIEVEPQTLCWETSDPVCPFVPDPDALADLCRLPQAKLVHGVSSPVGSSRPPDATAVRVLADVAHCLNAPLTSEHLSFNRISGDDGMSFAGMFLPPCQSPAGVEAAAEGARMIADAVRLPFSVEIGVNYLRPRPGELRDGDFVARTANDADCGILLDLHNIYANERNGRQTVADLVNELPLDRVWEVHVAGGFEFNSYWLDAHSGLVPDAVLDIAEWVLPRLPALRAVIFEVLPTYLPALDIEAVKGQLGRLRTMARDAPLSPPHRSDRSPPLPPPPPGPATPSAAPSPRQWEDQLGALAAGRLTSNCDPLSPGDDLAEDPAVPVLRKLVDAARTGQISDGLRLTVRALLLTLGAAATEELLASYLAEQPPQLWGSAEASAFAAWLIETDLDVLIRDTARIENTAIAVMRSRSPHTVRVTVDPLPTMTALGRGYLPDSVETGRFDVELTP